MGYVHCKDSNSVHSVKVSYQKPIQNTSALSNGQCKGPYIFDSQEVSYQNSYMGYQLSTMKRFIQIRFWRSIISKPLQSTCVISNGQCTGPYSPDSQGVLYQNPYGLHGLSIMYSEKLHTVSIL